MFKLGIVVPCFNEEEVITTTSEQLWNVLKDLIDKSKISEDSFIAFVDDGSKDKTWELIEQLVQKDMNLRGIKLAGNVGHQNALFAGLMTIKDEVDATISIDADLQDDISVIEEMVDKYAAGCEIVYGVRAGRKSDSFFKRSTAQGFYKFMNVMGVKSVYNHADFRLMGKNALAGLSQYEERNLYLRGIVSSMGFSSDCVYYDRKKREAGESKYPLGKMLSFAFEGITSFSVKPIDMILYMGLLMVLLSLVAAIYSFCSYFSGSVVSGWTSIILSIWFVGGIMMISLGIIGKYIGKIYIEVKGRPRYIVEKEIG